MKFSPLDGHYKKIQTLSLCIRPLGSFGGGGQLGTGGMGFNNDDMAARLQQQTMQMQQVSIK